jgi:hypothetical protein
VPSDRHIGRPGAGPLPQRGRGGIPPGRLLSGVR